MKVIIKVIMKVNIPSQDNVVLLNPIQVTSAEIRLHSQ
jgi:hypothetical protein